MLCKRGNLSYKVTLTKLKDFKKGPQESQLDFDKFEYIERLQQKLSLATFEGQATEI